jgi:hypothetical protein
MSRPLLASAALLALLLAGWWMRASLTTKARPANGIVTQSEPPALASPSAKSGRVESEPAPNHAAQSASPQLRILEQIFVSKNDNDPRLDTELRTLDEPTKAAFRAKYASLPLEKRNERGTLVFLLGRNLVTPEDYAFLKTVLSEAPCLSLADCNRAMESELGDSDHQADSLGIVLAYPQITALKAIEKARATSMPPHLRDAADAALGAGRASKSPLVAQHAERALQLPDLR